MAIERLVPGIVGATLGPDGFLWREAARERRIPTPKVVAIDTLAAGDVWHGALARAEGRDVADSERFANAAAAIKCSHAGGRLGTPHRHRVMALRSAPGVSLHRSDKSLKIQSVIVNTPMAMPTASPTLAGHQAMV